MRGRYGSLAKGHMLYGRSRLAASHTLGRMMHPGSACDAS